MKRGTPEHPKTIDLIERLQLPSYAVVGILESLWHWTARYAVLGDIGKYSNVQICKAIGWDNNPDFLIDALIKSKFVERCQKNRLVIHDWSDHADSTAKKYISRNNLNFVRIIPYEDCKCLDMSGQVQDMSVKCLTDTVSVAVPLPLAESVSVSETKPLTLFQTAEKVVEKSVSKKPPKVPSENGNAFADWCDVNKEAGRAQPIAAGKTFGICKRIATAIPDEAERKKLFKLYLDDQDAFVVNQGYPISLFESRLEKYRNSGVVVMKNGYDARNIYKEMHGFFYKAKIQLTPDEERKILEVGNLMTREDCHCAMKAYAQDCKGKGKPMKAMEFFVSRGLFLSLAGSLGIMANGKIDPNSEAGIEAMVLGWEAQSAALPLLSKSLNGIAHGAK